MTLDVTLIQDKCLDFQSYVSLIGKLYAEGKTTGNEQSEDMLHYTELNLHRMRRVEKTFSGTEELINAIENYPTPLTFLVLTEGWCGDSAQIVPALNEICKLSNPKFILKLCLRDENPEIMDQFLTNGARAIPKLIALNPVGEIAFIWGPRPKTAQDLVITLKGNPETAATFKEELHKWYAKDRSKSIMAEIATLLKKS